MVAAKENAIYFQPGDRVRYSGDSLVVARLEGTVISATIHAATVRWDGGYLRPTTVANELLTKVNQ